MPNRRRDVQERHERFQVGLLLGELNRRHRSSYRVVAEPNPPEAIIETSARRSWVEVTTAYMNAEFARDINSFATEGEAHVAMRSNVFVEPDAAFADNFVAAVKSKLEKDTYGDAARAYGPGYLMVSIQYPLFNARSMLAIRSAWMDANAADRGFFRSIYLSYRVYRGYKVALWRPPRP